jgi:uncharacterized protein (TIGR00725 family)
VKTDAGRRLLVMNRQMRIAVIGPATATDELADLAYEVGREIAAAECTLVCGGLGGVMEAACRGAAELGGLTIGILPGESATEANPYVSVPVVTGMGEARNYIVAATADVVIAVSGRLGTLSEIAFSLKRRTPVVGLGTWELDSRRLAPYPNVVPAGSPARAVQLAVELASRPRA